MEFVEATPRIELGMEVLQTSARRPPGTTMSRVSMRILAGPLVLCCLLVAGCTAKPVTGFPSPVSSHTQTSQATRCVEMLAGSSITTTSRSCVVPVGPLLLGLDCSTVNALPSDMYGETGGTIDTPTAVVVPIVNGRCRLSADTNGQVTRIAPAAQSPADVVGVVDFAVSSTDGVAGGISVRCGRVQCVTSELYSPSSFYLQEGKDPNAMPIQIAGRKFTFAAGRTYRMVVVAVGDHVKAWIDGTLVGAGLAFVTSGGYVTVFVYDFGAHATSYIDVQRFYALVPSG